MPRDVFFSPEAEIQIVALYEYLAVRASPTMAESNANGIVEHCEQLGDMPLVGVAREDIRQGLRTIFYRRRVVIAYSVAARAVTILAIFYGGQDYETLLRDD